MPENIEKELLEEQNVEGQLNEQLLKKKLLKIPVLNIVIKLLSKIKLPGLEGLSLYDLLELYVIGIQKEH